jgi:apolipoprotein N-acyltransferase
VLLVDQAPGRGSLIGFTFGIVAFGLILGWTRRFGWLPWSALVVLSALWMAALGGIAPLVVRGRGWLADAVGLAALWTTVEWVRGHWPLGGLTWGSLASTQVDLPLGRALPHVGMWGTGFLAAFAAASLAIAAAKAGDGERWRRGIPALVAGLVATAPMVLPLATASGGTLDVATLQVDVRTARPLGPTSEDLAVADAHVVLHGDLASDPPDLAVWGEGALDPAASRDAATMAAVSAAIRRVGVPTLVGAVTRDPDGSEHTAVLLYDGSGREVDRYEKVHLVPFGEYVPWRARLGWVEEIALIPVDRVPGSRVRTIRVDGLPEFGAPICFENAFPEIGRAMVRDGARFIVLTINNASYGFSAASEEHLAMSRVLAMETGRWVVHAAISGITAVIDPAGNVVATLGLFEPGITRATIRTSTAVTTAVRMGDRFAFAAFLLAVASFLRQPGRRRSAGAPAELGPSRTLVILPTYQEAGSIEEVVTRVVALDETIHLLVVDDGSPDGTAAIVRRLAEGEPRIRVIERPGKAGLASAYLLGFRRGLEEGFDLIVEMDSDLSHRPEDLPGILDAARSRCDLAIGSRYVPGGGVSNWSRGRLALSRAGNLYARWMIGVPVNDATSGFRAYRAELLRALTAATLRTDGYGFQIELVDRAVDLGARVEEVPITFAERASGASKMSRRIVVEALWNLTRWGALRRLRRHRPYGTQRP